MLLDPLPAPAAVLLLGDPRLRVVGSPIGRLDSAELEEGGRRLVATLADFRRRHGFGRGIAAPQIGLPWRLVAIDLGHGPRLLVDPEIEWTSEERFTLWDDCMSFPDLLVRVARHRSLTLRFRDPAGREERWERVDPALSELLQHELDHLDGVLAVDRAIDREALVLRRVWEEDRASFARLVDPLPPPSPRRIAPPSP